MEHPRALEHPGAMDGTLGRDGSGEDRQGSNGTVKMEWGKVRCDGPWGHRDPNPAPHCQWEHPQGPRHILGLGWRRRSPHSPENSRLPNHGAWERGDPAAFGASQCPPRALAMSVWGSLAAHRVWGPWLPVVPSGHFGFRCHVRGMKEERHRLFLVTLMIVF